MKLMFVGDINLGEYYTSLGHGPRTFLESRDVFENVAPILARADFVLGNLEAPLSNLNRRYNDPESAALRGDPRAATILARHGFKVLQVANNHSVQHGPDAFEQTLDALTANGIKPIGLLNQHIHVIHTHGMTIGFLAASDVPDNTHPGQTLYQELNEEFLVRCEKAVEEVDHVFVLLHWGLESSTRCLPYQHGIMERLRQKGVRGVVGSHPHLFYGLHLRDNFIAAPSLGNFVFDLCWDQRLVQTGILEVTLDKCMTARVWPVRISNNGCLPTPTEAPVEIAERETKLYDLGSDMRGEQRRKMLYFLKNFRHGDRMLKTKFMIRKFRSALKRIAGG